MFSARSIILNFVITVLLALYFFFHQDLNLTSIGAENSIYAKVILEATLWTYLLNIIPCIICLLIDNFREVSPTDDFSGSNLFYRYGFEVQRSTITIGVDKIQSGKTPSDIAIELNNFLFTEISGQFVNRP